MKNLNKKIGAIALAGMVVLGGFAASGAQSFADFNPYAEKLNKLIRKSGYRYEVMEFYGSREHAERAINSKYSFYKGFNRHIVRVNDRSLSRILRRFNYSKAEIFILQYEGGFFSVSLPRYIK